MYYLLQNDELLRYVESGSARTAGQDGVKKELLVKYPVFLPSIEEQKSLVKQIESMFLFCERIEARLELMSTELNRLTQAIYLKAFNGELIEN